MTSKLAKQGWVLAAALHVLGCECEDEPALQPAAVTPAPAPAPATEALVHATRSGLPEAVPAITLTLDRDHFALSNAAVIATWPAPDRTRVAEARPETAAATWPVVEREGTLPTTPGYRAPEVEAALTLAREAELARSAGGAPSSYALRVQPETPWSSVVRVMFSSGLANFNEPRFVLARGGGEVELRLPLPRATDEVEITAGNAAVPPLPPGLTGRDPAEVANAIREALAAHPPTPSAQAEAPAEEPIEALSQVTLVLSDQGLNVMRNDTRLAAGCTREAVGREPTIATAQLNPEALTQCLTSAGPSPRGYVLSADGTLSFSRVIAVAETVSGLGHVMFGVIAH
jgi:hypothetical protein